MQKRFLNYDSFSVLLYKTCEANWKSQFFKENVEKYSRMKYSSKLRPCLYLLGWESYVTLE